MHRLRVGAQPLAPDRAQEGRLEVDAPSGLVALAALAPERTVYVSSLSKSLASGLRFGFMPLPAELRMDRIATALARQGIAVSKAAAYATTRHAPHALRLGLSSLPQPALREALLRVRETIERHPPP